ncbi:hypothetical protein GCM10022406_09060 [Hymenobacter algoricola]|uniref:Uncharacterized protein n=2 Tax=Hymenobacter algoricola TaxID=486267 RepID=A0ABP7MLP8_9BACT
MRLNHFHPVAMNKEDLNRALVSLIEKKQELHKLSYDDTRYDDVEEELHELEDSFNEEYGAYLEEMLEKVHEKLCPDTDVLLPTAYLPNDIGGDTGYVPSHKEGVWVDSDEFPGKEARLVLVPNPTRLILSVGKTVRKEVWKA